MKKEKIEELRKKISEMSDQVLTICSELFSIADNYYDEGEPADTLKSLAIDADELHNKLDAQYIIPDDTVPCNICGEENEYQCGDKVGYITYDGFVNTGCITSILMKDDVHGDTFTICDCVTTCVATIPVNNVIPSSWSYHFSQIYWNKMVKLLWDNKKFVTLTQQNRTFSVIIHNTESETELYRRENMTLHDFTVEFVNSLKEV